MAKKPKKGYYANQYGVSKEIPIDENMKKNGVSTGFVEKSRSSLGLSEMIELNKLKSKPTKQLSVNQMGVNTAYGREIIANNLRKIMTNFNLEALGEPIICDVRKENSKVPYEIIDGNHRVNVIRSLFGETTKVKCTVLPYMPLEQRAELFRTLNEDRKQPTKLEIFKSKLVLGDQDALNIHSICRAVGVNIAGIDGKGFPTSNGITFLEASYRHGTLSYVLRVVKEAYEDKTTDFRKSYNSSTFLKKLDNFICMYFDELDFAKLTEKIGAISPVEWIHRLGQLIHTDKTGVSVFVVEYNKGMKSNRLDMSKINNPPRDYAIAGSQRIQKLPETKATRGYGLK